MRLIYIRPGLVWWHLCPGYPGTCPVWIDEFHVGWACICCESEDVLVVVSASLALGLCADSRPAGTGCHHRPNSHWSVVVVVVDVGFMAASRLVLLTYKHCSCCCVLVCCWKLNKWRRFAWTCGLKPISDKPTWTKSSNYRQISKRMLGCIFATDKKC